MITETQYQAWLNSSDAQRVILAALEHADGIEYVSDIPYVFYRSDELTDDVKTALKEIPNLTSSITSKASYGDLLLYNNSKRWLDEWIYKKWRGYPITLYIGDERWPFSDFRIIRELVNDGVQAPSNERVLFKIFDRKAYFDKPIKTSRLANNQGVPQVKGEVFNIEPVLLDEATHHYQCNDENLTIVAVKANGWPVAYTSQNDGTLKLNDKPYGRVTLDAIEPNTTVAQIVRWVCEQVGWLDIDQQSLDVLPTYSIGWYFDTTQSAKQILDNILEDLGLYWDFDRLGRLFVKSHTLPANPVYELKSGRIKNGKLTLVEIIDPEPEVVVNYQRNWRVQDKDSLAAQLSESEAEALSSEYRRVTASNHLTGYPLASPGEPINTPISNEADAQAFTNMKALMRKEKQATYKIEGLTAPFAFNIGDTIKVYYPYYGFQDGIDVTVLKMIEQSVSAKTQIELTIWRTVPDM